jgi:hypothetical protein
MRGRPWIRIALVCLGVILMGIPVYRLTSSHVYREPVSQVNPTIAKILTITLTFAHPPESFEVSYLGKQVFTGNGPQTEFTESWTVALPPAGADLLLKVKWPDKTPQTAVEMKVEENGDALKDQTFWGTATLTEIETVMPHQP